MPAHAELQQLCPVAFAYCGKKSGCRAEPYQREQWSACGSEPYQGTGLRVQQEHYQPRAVRVQFHTVQGHDEAHLLLWRYHQLLM